MGQKVTADFEELPDFFSQSDYTLSGPPSFVNLEESVKLSLWFCPLALHVCLCWAFPYSVFL